MRDDASSDRLRSEANEELRAIKELCDLGGLSLEPVLRDAHRRLLERVALLLKPSAAWFVEPRSFKRYWMFLETVTGHSWPLVEAQLWYKKIRSPSDTREEIPSSMRYQVLERDHRRCVVCGRSGKETALHVDHIIPWDQGGPTEADNLQTLCLDCNLGKSDTVNPGGGHE